MVLHCAGTESTKKGNMECVQGPLSPPGPLYEEYRRPAQNRQVQWHRQSQNQTQGREYRQSQEHQQVARPRPGQGESQWRRYNRNGASSAPSREPRDDALFRRMVDVYGEYACTVIMRGKNKENILKILNWSPLSWVQCCGWSRGELVNLIFGVSS